MPRHQRLELARVDQSSGDAKPVLQRNVAHELGALVGGLRQEHVAMLVVVDRQADDLLEVTPELDRLEREADVDLGRILAANAAGRTAGAARAQRVAFEQDDTATVSTSRQLVGDACPDDAAADDDDVGRLSHGATPRCASRLPAGARS